MTNQHRSRRAGDADEVVMLRQPKTPVAPFFRMVRERKRIAEYFPQPFRLRELPQDREQKARCRSLGSPGYAATIISE